MAPNNYKATDTCFVLKAKFAHFPDDPRYGLVASKRAFKLAVERNRAKRLIRDWLSFNEDLMSPDLDYVFIVQTEILDCNRDAGREMVAGALKKILEQHKKHAK